MRQIGALADGELPTAEQAADGLTALQAMLGEWETRGLRLGALVDLTLATTTVIPVPVTHLNAIALNLAVLLVPEYGAQTALPMLAPMAERSFDALMAAYVRPLAVPIEPALVAQYGNITSVDAYGWEEQP